MTEKLSPFSRDVARSAMSVPPGKGRSTQANVMASRWNIRFCGLDFAVTPVNAPVPAPQTRMARLSAGSETTFWNGEPGPMTGGEMFSVAELDDETSEVSTN